MKLTAYLKKVAAWIANGEDVVVDVPSKTPPIEPRCPVCGGPAVIVEPDRSTVIVAFKRGDDNGLLCQAAGCVLFCDGETLRAPTPEELRDLMHSEGGLDIAQKMAALRCRRWQPKRNTIGTHKVLIAE